ncbi:hypothetical protein H9P43_002819 [Blastocladiella emersonii ATCC 22665]|nr:hypothetical protein H9P43_002819 [Blastocladiella emersonii ATCC 22665]
MNTFALAVAVVLAVLGALAPRTARAATLPIGIHLPFLQIPEADDIVKVIRLLEPDLQALSSTHSFRLVYNSTNTSLVASSGAMLHGALNLGYLGVIGDMYSSQTIPQALDATYLKVFMCSGSASASALSDDDYLYLYRTIADDPQQGTVLALFIRNMGWARVNIFFSTSTYGESVSQGFVAAASSANLTISSMLPFNPAARDFVPQVTAASNSGTLIHVIAATPDEAAPLLKAAKAAGLVGPENVWIGPEAFTLALSGGSKAAADPETAAILSAGFFFVRPVEDSGNAKAKAFRTKWSAAYPAKPVPAYGFLYRDCLFSLAEGLLGLINKYGLSRVVNRQYELDTNELVTNFLGVSGDITFDVQGNRVQAFEIVNLQGALTSPVVTHTIASNRTILAVTAPRFASGTAAVPSDRIAQVMLLAQWTSPGCIVLAAVTVAMILAILATDAYLFLNKTVPQVRHLSFPFLNLICVGCVVTLASTLMSIGTPNAGQCIASLWIFAFGFEMVVGASIAKAYRIWTIFENKSLVKVSGINDRMLFGGVGGILALQSILLVVWTAGGAPVPQLVSARTYYYVTCRSADPAFHTALTVSTLVYNGALLLVFLFLAFKTRHVSSSYNESKYMHLAGQTIALSAIVITAFALFDFGAAQLTAFYVKHAMILFAVAATFFALVGRLAIDVRASNKSKSLTSTGNNTSRGQQQGGGGQGGTSGSTSNLSTTWMAKGTFPVRQAGLISQWRSTRVQVFAMDGQMSFIPNTSTPTSTVSIGFVLDLTTTLVNPTPPGSPHCIEVLAQGKSWLVQFETDRDRKKWADLLCSIATTTASSKGRSGSKNTLNGSRATGLNGSEPVLNTAAAGSPTARKSIGATAAIISGSHSGNPAGV